MFRISIQSLLIVSFLFFITPLVGSEFSLKSSNVWQGFNREVYLHKGGGFQAFVVKPKEINKERSWIWRARFFGHQPQLDLALLSRGYHLVYCDVSQLFGSPEAIQRWNNFYSWAREEFNLAPKVILEGMSRGGLVIYNWAIANPNKVALIYADNPVIDIRSWPGGKGKGKGSPNDWNKCLKAYGYTEDNLDPKLFLPIKGLEKLAERKVPLLHIVGLEDKVVPVDENTTLIEKKYHALKGTIKVIKKPGLGHHPHSLKDPAPILEFIDKIALR